MKKTLVILLALVMVFALATTAMAADEQYVPYPDIADQDEAIQSAIERLTILGALKGYNDEGTVFAPANNITREEFATIGVRIAGLEDKVANYQALASAYTDVENDRWSKGYINCAKEAGIMIGRGQGIFDPKANVTMQEVVTVLLRAVGYDDRLPGNWPDDYSNKAVNIGIAKYVDFIGAKAATRGEVASLVNEALNLYQVYYVENELASGIGQIVGTNGGIDYVGYPWDNDNNGATFNGVDQDGYAYVTYSTNQQSNRLGTLLYESFGAYMVPGWAYFADDEDSFSEVAAWSYDDFEEKELLVEFYSFATTSNSQAPIFDGSYELASLYGISGGNDITDLANHVAAITMVDEEVVYTEFMTETERVRDVEKAIEDDHNNGEEIEEESYGETWTVKKGLKIGLNNVFKEGKIWSVKDFQVFEMLDFGVVDEVTEKGVKFNEDIPYDFIDLKDTTVDYAFYLMNDKKFIDADDLVAGDVVYVEEAYVVDAADDDVTVCLVFRPESGSFDAMQANYIKVDDARYDVDKTTNPTVLNSYYSHDKAESFNEYVYSKADDIEWGDTIQWVPSYAFTRFAYFTDEIKLYNIGILDSYDYTSKYDRTDGVTLTYITKMTIILADGSTETYDLEEDVLVDESLLANARQDDFSDMTELRYPDEGSLIEFVLNKDGEIVDLKRDTDDANGNFDNTVNGSDTVYFPFGHAWLDANPNDMVCDLDHLFAAAANTPLEGTFNKNGVLTIDGDKYDIADDAVVFLVYNDDKADLDAAYDTKKTKVISGEDLKESDFTAFVFCAYEYDGNEVSTIFLKNAVFDASIEYKSAIVEDIDWGDKKIVVNDGQNVACASNSVRDDIRALFTPGTPSIILYKTVNGEIQDAADVFVIEDADDVTNVGSTGFNDITTGFPEAWRDNGGMSLINTTVASYSGNLKLTGQTRNYNTDNFVSAYVPTTITVGTTDYQGYISRVAHANIILKNTGANIIFVIDDSYSVPTFFVLN